MGILQKIEAEQMKSRIPGFRPGDTVRVHQLIQEGGKERVQIFEGVVMYRDGAGLHESFSVRKISYNVGVERIFPVHSPRVTKIEIKQRGRVRRARLFYLRDLRGKAARIQQLGRGAAVQAAETERAAEAADAEINAAAAEVTAVTE